MAKHFQRHRTPTAKRDEFDGPPTPDGPNPLMESFAAAEIPLSVQDEARASLDPDLEPQEPLVEPSTDEPEPEPEQLPEGGYVEPVDRARRTLLRDIERAGHFGHGLDRDRTLLRDAASLIRSLLGLAPDDPLD